MNIFINMGMKNTEIFAHIMGFINIKKLLGIKLIPQAMRKIFILIPILLFSQTIWAQPLPVKLKHTIIIDTDDPHSSYMDPKSFKDMQVQTRGEFGGLGIEVTMEDGLIKVVAPIDETPAAKAGVMANDI